MATLQVEPLKVYVGTPGGGAPNLGAGPVSYLTCTEISRTSGGRSLDYAVFEVELADLGLHVRNLQTPLDFSVEVQVWTPYQGTHKPVFAGDLTVQSILIGQGVEAVQVVSQTMPYHFGNVCDGWYLYNPLTESPVKTQDDLLFNPVVDGVVINNMSDKSFNPQTGVNDFKLWIDPESIRTESARGATGQSPAEWTIKEAVNALCQLMNSDEEFIKNFDPSDPDYTTLFDDALPIRNLSLKRGLHLPDYLDALLLPLGFDWYINYEVAGSNQLTRRIKVFKRAAGTEKTIKLADIGDFADFNTTNIEQTTITTDIGRTYNKVVVWGGVQEREITVELKKAWDVGDDSATAEDLDMTNPDGTYKDKKNVWRLFAANEAGDYNDADGRSYEILDLSSVFDDYVPRRRAFKEPLHFRRATVGVPTKDPDEILIEYYDGTEWLPLKKEWLSQVRILTHEMGVIFTGATPIEEIMELGSTFKIRVTGTVVGDKRLKGEAENIADSPNARENVLYIDASDRFRDSIIQVGGDYASVYPTQSSSMLNEHDDHDAITAYAEKILEQEISAAMNCDFVLMGLQASYGIGDLLTSIEGRNISLNRRSPLTGQTAKYPQVIGVTWRPQEQSTHLMVDTNEGL
ncbi:MAG TPA: hypothetical protein VLA12_22990 [Planctomycetaceae bacterium]|nr:hypothetical protein [Planctomycetaceae bacterium]